MALCGERMQASRGRVPDYPIWYCDRYPVSQIRKPDVHPDGRPQDEADAWKWPYREVLKRSIQEHGLLNPLIILNHPDRMRYEKQGDRWIRTGRNRLDAITQLGWTHVPAIVTGECPYECERVHPEDVQAYFREGEIIFDEVGPRLIRATRLKKVHEMDWTQYGE